MVIAQKGLTQSDVIELTKNIEKQLIIIQKLKSSEFNIKAAELLKECISTVEANILASPLKTSQGPMTASTLYKNQLNLFTASAKPMETEDIESTSSLNPGI